MTIRFVCNQILFGHIDFNCVKLFQKPRNMKLELYSNTNIIHKNSKFDIFAWMVGARNSEWKQNKLYIKDDIVISNS